MSQLIKVGSQPWSIGGGARYLGIDAGQRRFHGVGFSGLHHGAVSEVVQYVSGKEKRRCSGRSIIPTQVQFLASDARLDHSSQMDLMVHVAIETGENE